MLARARSLPRRAAAQLARKRQLGRMLRFYSQFVGPGDLVFDVGANVGNRVEIFLELEATVVAIEPQEACVTELERRWGGHLRLHVLHKGLGASEGEQELYVADASTLTTMSRAWISATSGSGRFADHRWRRAELVPITTLDRVIEEYGLPAFCKIDVEGFELEVLKGLSRPLNVLSFEFAAEVVDGTRGCVERLVELGARAFNYSPGESMELALRDWASAEEMLAALPGGSATLAFGDVYARFS